jgi:oleandomycin transport system permease protein
MTAVSQAQAPRRIGVRATFLHTGIMARRNLIHLRSDPVQVIGMTAQPMMFVLLFVYVFGGAIAGSSSQYVEFALPGFLTQAAAFASQQTGIGLNVDFQRGIIDRFRSLNMARAAVVAGRVVADLARVITSVVIIGAFGVLLGFRFHGPFAANLLGLALIVALGFALCWPMAIIGITVRSPESVTLFTFLIVLPLSFASSVFVPVSSMPGWLQPVVRANPVTVVTNAARELLIHGTVTAEAAKAGLWSLAIVVVFAPLVTALYQRR